MKIYTLHDKVADKWYPPFVVKTDAEAFRTFEGWIKEGESLISQHPADFDLYRTAEFDDATGEITGSDVQLMGTGAQYVLPFPDEGSKEE